ncbi:MAG: hypothetical protein JWQ21_2121 [Herminiimonas sp.]|nr:hypothetical protein [Herminiimonas sp.]
MDDSIELEYAGFWLRTWAGIIDSILMALIGFPLLLGIYGSDWFASDALVAGPSDFVISWIFPAIAVIAFWMARHAMPGKMAISATIVDEKTGGPPSAGQHVGRYFGYFLSAIPFGLGFLWVAFDKKKQGWHDKLAGTVVVRPRKNSAAVHFAQQPDGSDRGRMHCNPA